MHEQRIKDLLINCEKRGGLVSHRRLSNGEDKPYELNIIGGAQWKTQRL